MSSSCRVCEKKIEAIFSSILLNNFSVQYFKCSNCGYVQTEEPFWLEEAYKVSINESDTGLMMRALWHRNVAANLIYFLFNIKGKFLDFAGGYGVFVRLMRDTGFEFLWKDLHTENLFAKGFEFLETDKNDIELITVFETFEHFVSPALELKKLLCISKNILLSTEFIPENTPDPNDWWYYGREHGQHIGFFQKKTFDYLAKKHNLFFYTNGQNIHLITENRLLPFEFKLIVKTSKLVFPFIQKMVGSLIWKDFEKLKESV